MTTRTSIREVLDGFFDERMKAVYTAIPAHVAAFDPATQLAQLELGIQRVDIDGATVTPPAILECPVLFMGDSWAVETQIDPGCEGLAVFSQRCIDGWVNTGGVAVNPLRRFFDMQDAFFIPGFRPMPRALPAFKNNGIRLRNNAGTHYVWIKSDGSIVVENGNGHIRMAADGTVTINGVVIDTSSNVTTPTTMKAATVTGTTNVYGGGISVNSHTHTGVESGPSSTGGPQ